MQGQKRVTFVLISIFSLASEVELRMFRHVSGLFEAPGIACAVPEPGLLPAISLLELYKGFYRGSQNSQTWARLGAKRMVCTPHMWGSGFSTQKKTGPLGLIFTG